MKSKPRGMKYTDLCIYIDKTNYYRDKNNNPTGLRELSNEEIENIYSYLYYIIYALAVKRRLLTKKDDYDTFCIEAAGDIYIRLRKPDQDYSGKNTRLCAIKSVLNYIKGCLGFKCITWRGINYNQTVSLSFSGEKKYNVTRDFVTKQVSDQYASRHKDLYEEFADNLPSFFKENVDRILWIKRDESLKYDLLLSLYLTFLNASTLKQSQMDYCDEDKTLAKILSQLNQKDVYTIKWGNNKAITKDLIDITLKKICNNISEEYGEAARLIDPTEEEITSILNSAYPTYDTNNTGGKQ